MLMVMKGFFFFSVVNIFFHVSCNGTALQSKRNTKQILFQRDTSVVVPIVLCLGVEFLCC